MTDVTLTLTRSQLIGIALATQSAADAAYLDDRLMTAEDQFALASQLWAHAGHNELATQALRKSIRAKREWVNAQVSELEDEDV